MSTDPPRSEERLDHYMEQLQNQQALTLEQLRRYNEQQSQKYNQPLPTTHYALRLSDEDVARIVEAVVARLRASGT